MPTPRKPTALLSERRARDRGEEVTYPVGAPACPKCLSPEAKAEWRRVVKMLLDVGILQKIDLALLASYCRTWAVWLKLTEASQTWDFTRESDRKQERLLANTEERLARLASHFGLSPSCRSRIAMPEGTRELSDAEKKYFERWTEAGAKFYPGSRTPIRDRDRDRERSEWAPPPWAKQQETNREGEEGKAGEAGEGDAK